MPAITKVDLEGLARKRRVKSLHQWFAALQRIVNKPAMLEANDSPKYAPERP